MDKESFKDSVNKELEEIKSEAALSETHRKKKLVLWLVRTIIAAILFIIYWDSKWAKWCLIAYIPINLLGLFAIYSSAIFANRKINKAKKKLEELS